MFFLPQSILLLFSSPLHVPVSVSIQSCSDRWLREIDQKCAREREIDQIAAFGDKALDIRALLLKTLILLVVTFYTCAVCAMCVTTKNIFGFGSNAMMIGTVYT